MIFSLFKLNPFKFQISKNLKFGCLFCLFSSSIFFESIEATLTSYPVGVGPYQVVAGRFAGKAFDDVAVTSSDSLGLTDLTIFLNDGQDHFVQSQQFTIALKGTLAAVTTGFFNNDTAIDLAVLTNPGSFSSNTNLFIFANNLNGTFSQQSANASITEASDITSGIFRGGLLPNDLAIVSFNQRLLAIGIPDTFGLYIPQIISLTASPSAVTSGPIFNPAVDDIVVTYGDTNQIQIFRNNNNGLGTFTPDGIYSVGEFPSDVIIRDLNGDGFADIAVTNAKSNSVSILINKGDGTFNQAVNYAVEDVPLSLTSGLFNTFGNVDLIVANQARSTVSILLNNGDGTFQPAISVPTGSGPSGVAPLVLANESTGIATSDFTGGTLSIIVNPIPTLVASYSPIPSLHMREFLKFHQFAANPTCLNVKASKVATTSLISLDHNLVKKSFFISATSNNYSINLNHSI